MLFFSYSNKIMQEKQCIHLSAPFVAFQDVAREPGGTMEVINDYTWYALTSQAASYSQRAEVASDNDCALRILLLPAHNDVPLSTLFCQR
jgi:hypothetical protein